MSFVTLRPGSGSAPPDANTTRSGLGHRGNPAPHGPSDRGTPRTHPPSRWSPTDCPPPVRPCRCCRSSRPRPTRNASCWSRPNWPASWPGDQPAAQPEPRHDPLVARYDHYERTVGPRLLHLFQRDYGSGPPSSAPQACGNGSKPCSSAWVTRPGRGTNPPDPHDFRRIFSTTAVQDGSRCTSPPRSWAIGT